MTHLGCSKNSFALAWLIVMSACCSFEEHRGEVCEDASECTDDSCQPASDNGESTCRTSCTNTGQWACNYAHNAVYYCNGTEFTKLGPCAKCATSTYTFADSFTCDSETKSAPTATKTRVKIDFALVGGLCVTDESLCFGTRLGVECIKVGYACSPDRKSILACSQGIWQVQRTCTSPKVCDAYGEKRPEGYSGENRFFHCA